MKENSDRKVQLWDDLDHIAPMVFGESLRNNSSHDFVQYYWRHSAAQEDIDGNLRRHLAGTNENRWHVLETKAILVRYRRHVQAKSRLPTAAMTPPTSAPIAPPSSVERVRRLDGLLDYLPFEKVRKRLRKELGDDQVEIACFEQKGERSKALVRSWGAWARVLWRLLAAPGVALVTFIAKFFGK